MLYLATDSLFQFFAVTQKSSAEAQNVALFFFGGEVMRSFSEALLVGIVVGTYSSIYVVANLIFTLNVTKEDFLVVEKEEIDEMP